MFFHASGIHFKTFLKIKTQEKQNCTQTNDFERDMTYLLLYGAGVRNEYPRASRRGRDRRRMIGAPPFLMARA